MKVLQISSHFPPHLGGVENVAKELSEHIARKYYPVEVFTSDIGCKDRRMASKRNLKINYLKSWDFVHTPLIPSLFWELMKSQKDSVMHVHVAQAFIPEVVLLVSKIKRIPYIAQVHIDLEPSSWIGKILLAPYKKIFLKRFLKNAKKVVVLTKDYRKIIQEKYGIPRRSIKIIPNGTLFKINYSKSFELNNPIKLLFVGRLSSQKNIPLLLESFKRTCSRGKNIELHIVGDGEEMLFAKEYISKNDLGDRIFLRGRLEGEKLKSMYRTSDIFIFPTKQESFGNVYLEAMAFGLPIITTNVLAVRNVVKNNYNGLLVKPTPKNIAKAIDKLIKNPKLRKKLAENGLKEVKKYSWDKIVKRYTDIYKQVMGETKK